MSDTTINDNELVHLIRLHSAEGLGERTLCKLLLKEVTLEQVIAEVNKGTLFGLKTRSKPKLCSTSEAEDTAATIKQEGIQILPIFHTNYPSRLHHLPDPPPILYYKGTLRSDMNALAVVGTRSFSGYGRSVLTMLLPELIKYNLAIISGMAMGIDAYAHELTLKDEGYTVAVLGSGIDVVAPRQNYRLYRRICERGCVMSEFPMTTQPTKYTFPKRNRIIAALGNVALIVEASEKSGALITAEYASELGRDVLAVPGSILAETSKGPNKLLAIGAKPVLSPEDVLVEFGIETSITPAKIDTQSFTQIQTAVIAGIGGGKVEINELIERLEYSSIEILTAVSDLELEQVISREGDTVFRN